MAEECEARTWHTSAIEAFNVAIGAVVSIVVLLIFAEDRLDGDELWKGAVVGPAVVGGCRFFRSSKAQAIIGQVVAKLSGSNQSGGA